MKYEDWLKQPYKTGGTLPDGSVEVITNEQGMKDLMLGRAARRAIKRDVEKGKKVFIDDYLNCF